MLASDCKVVLGMYSMEKFEWQAKTTSVVLECRTKNMELMPGIGT